jgi:hypothetical protein
MSDDFLTLDQIGRINVAWFVALIALRHRNPRRMFFMLKESGWSPLTDEDRKLITVAEAYLNEPWIAINKRGDKEKRGDDTDGKIKRIADKYGVESTALDNYLDFGGGTYRRIRDWRNLELAFEEWGCTLYLGPPPISQPASGARARSR